MSADTGRKKVFPNQELNPDCLLPPTKMMSPTVTYGRISAVQIILDVDAVVEREVVGPQTMKRARVISE